MFDLPRPQAKATIASAKQMGVAIKMVTGDQLAIARETARQLCLGTNILDSTRLGDIKATATPEQAAASEKVAVFGLFMIGKRYFHLDRDQLQTLMYLKLSIAGHLTIFLARTSPRDH